MASIALWPERLRSVIWRLDPTNPSTSLADVEREVVRRYRVSDMPAQSLPEGQVALFDVRTAEEFAAGHIEGAIHVDPDMSAADFLARHGELLRQRPAVFYCAVGVRSSVMVQRLSQAPSVPVGAVMHNLRGGAFRWVAEGRSLVSGGKPGQIHPYDANWEKLLNRTLASQSR